MVPLGILMAVGAWYEMWLGWVSGLLLTTSESVDVLLSWKRSAGTTSRTISIATLMWAAFLISLALALVLRPGRLAFGVTLF